MRPILCVACCLALSSCTHSNSHPGSSHKHAESAGRAATLLPADGPTEEDYPELRNLLQVSDTIYSGAEPKTAEAFASLAQLGVKTVVSVDGARPNLELAEKYGLQYVQIPIGYDGISEEAGKSFAKLAQEADGPLYIHCHHGQHRGPAAAAATCVASGATDGKGALEILKKAGTSQKYQGLWKDVEAYQPPPAGTELPELVSVAKVDSFVAAMAKLDRGADHLELCRDANWSVPQDHPDLVASQEAQKVREGMQAALESLPDGADDRLRVWFAESLAIAQALETALKQGNHPVAEKRFELLDQSCNKCHREYRNLPK